LPQAKTIEAREDNNITVAINAEDRIAVDEREGSFEELPDLLTKAFETKGMEKMVIIRADKQVLHGRVLVVMDLVKRLGGSRISLATVQKK
jgi:biopolymer transport protein ExbD